MFITCNSIYIIVFLFECSGDHRDLHVLTHSFPTRRSSDLRARCRERRSKPSPGESGGNPASCFSTEMAVTPTGGVSSRHSLPPTGGWGRFPGRAWDDRDGGKVTRRRFIWRSEEHTSELQSLMRISYAVFCLKKKNKHT